MSFEDKYISGDVEIDARNRKATRAWYRAVALNTGKWLAAGTAIVAAFGAMNGHDPGSSILIGGGTALAAAFGAAAGSFTGLACMWGLSAMARRMKIPGGDVSTDGLASAVAGIPLGGLVGAASAAYAGYKWMGALALVG